MNTKLTGTFLNSFDTEFHIAALTETWLNNNTHNSEIMCEKYQIFRRDRIGKNGGGVLIAVSSLFSAEELILENYCNVEIIVVTTQILNISLFITCSYIPPNSEPRIYEMHARLIKFVANKLKPTDYLIVLGDFNLPSASWVSSEDTEHLTAITSYDWTQDFFTCLSESNVFQINNIKNSNMRLLDLVFVNSPSQFEVSRTNPLCTPEDRHHPTLHICTPFPIKKSGKNVRECFCFNRTNFAMLNQLLINIDWTNILTPKIDGSDFEIVIQEFYSILKTCISACTPVIRIVSSNRPPWFSNTLSWLKNKRNRLHNKFKRSKSSFDRSQYLIASSRFTIENKKCYEKYVNKIKSNIKTNPKLFFKFVNSKRKVSSYPSTMKFNDTTHNNDAEIANIFAEFFSTTFSTNIHKKSTYPYKITSSSSIHIPSLDVSTVLNNIKSIKSSDKPGPDGIPSIIIKNCADSLVNPLTSLFNYSLKFGLFPSCWKESFIIPLYKSGSRNNVTNYRAIVKLNSISKLFEKTITNLLKHELSSIISPKQHGFCRGRSTATNLMEFTTCINSSFYNSQQTDVVYTDFSKAFDKVNHELLIEKLYLIGFSEALLHWIESYLKGRKQCVIFNNSNSKYINVPSGVPQGSHIGPILFLLFINDLPNVIQHSNILLYADDVKLSLNITNHDDSSKLQSDLNNFSKWCKVNLMELNINKCKVMTFTRYSPLSTKYFIMGNELVAVDSCIDLGIYFDRKLTFNTHVTYIVNKGNSVLYFIKRWSKEFKDPYVTKNLFTSLVRPILEYCSVVWDPQYILYIKSIESVQKQFLLFCLRHLQWDPTVHLPPYRSRLALIKLPTLKSRRTVSNVTFFINLLQGKIDSIFLLSQIAINIPGRQLRFYEPLHLKFHRRNYMNFDPIQRVCSEINEFYADIDFADKVNQIRTKLLYHMNSTSYVYNWL